MLFRDADVQLGCGVSSAGHHGEQPHVVRTHAGARQRLLDGPDAQRQGFALLALHALTGRPGRDVLDRRVHHAVPGGNAREVPDLPGERRVPEHLREVVRPHLHLVEGFRNDVS